MKTLRRNGLKGQKPLSPGHRPGCKDVSRFALKGQKLTYSIVAFALTGRWLPTTFTQGAGCLPHLPRAMPWAGGFPAFQAVFAKLEKLK